MKVTVKNIDVSGVISKVSRLKTNAAFGKYAANQAGILMSKYVPEMNHMLVNYRAEPWNVIYDQPYAAYQYNGTHLKHPNKPTATSHWDRHVNAQQLAARLQAYIDARGL